MIVVLFVALFSPDRDYTYSKRHYLAKRKPSYIILHKGISFGSDEPSSPKIGCMGHMKLKQTWDKVTKHMDNEKPAWTAKGKLLRLKKYNLKLSIYTHCQ